LSIRKAIVAAAGVALTVGLSLGLSGTALASDPTVPSTAWNEIYIPFDNVAGNRLCVDVTNGSPWVDTVLQFYSCHGYDSNGTPQRFQFLGAFKNSIGAWTGVIVNVGSNLCISTPPGVALASGVQLVQEPCDQAQGWLIRRQNANGTDPLIELALIDKASNRLTDLCMAAGNMGDNNHTPLVATTCQPLLPTAGDLSQVLELA
jgi:hypothetical protein